jgi:hypothetical protein
MLKDRILAVLVEHDGCCMDNEDDRERLAEAIKNAIVDRPPLSYEEVADRLDGLAMELRMRSEKERDALRVLDRVITEKT